MTLTGEQRLFAEHDGEVFLEACPGSGKTRAITARLAVLAPRLPVRRGVAVLSFTNKAIEELALRCSAAGVGALLRHPGFVGTFDGFVRHFLFWPDYVVAGCRRARVVDSWRSLGIEVRLSGADSFRGPGVELDLFEPGTGRVDPDAIRHSALRAHVVRHRARYERRALLCLRRLGRSGLYSAGGARAAALQVVQDAARSAALGRAVAARFQEIIVDEGQDCNPSDLEILRWARGHGVRVTFVCDTEQAIYEFRGGRRDSVLVFAARYRPEDRLRLTGNFRSSPPICALAASFRCSTDPDLSLGETRGLTTPVEVYAYHGPRVTAGIGRLFSERAAAVGVSLPGLVVLAHRESDARLAAGWGPATATGRSRAERLARAAREFWSGCTAHSRVAALGAVEGLLLDICKLREEEEPVPRALERHGLSGLELRRLALGVLARLPRSCGEEDGSSAAWLEAARAAVIEARRDLLPAGARVASALPSPHGDDWLAQILGPAGGASLRCATVHSAKGGEYPGVCVVIPTDRGGLTSRLVDTWARRADDDPKRVIYVGVTRAMRFVALAVPSAVRERCCGILRSAAVPHQVFGVPGG